MAFVKYIQILCSIVTLCCVKCELNVTEGSPCTDDGFNGTCVSLYKCSTAATSFTYLKAGYTKGIPPLPKNCSNEGDVPVVCCTDCFIPKEEKFKDYAVNVYGVYVWKSGPKALDKCLDYLQNLPYWCRGNAAGAGYALRKHVNESGQCHFMSGSGWLAVGGRAARRREFAHMALLGYGDDPDSAQWLCGGTVISERFIITAGHCVYSARLGPVEFAALGILKRTDPAEYWKIHKIKRIIKHPEYKPPCKYNDIALLETEKEIQFTPDLLPACLDTVYTQDRRRVFADATGWGQLGHRSDLAETLQVVNLEQFNESVCSSKYPEHRHMKRGYDHDIQMCYGPHEYSIMDTCQGDSGGPLQINEAECLYTVIGVTSFGQECGFRGTAGIYTRVLPYVPWIEGIVWPDE